MNPFAGWPSGAPEAACGLAYTAIVALIRWAYKRRRISFAGVMALFLSGVMIPPAVAFMMQPFQDPKPDLSEHGVWYFPVAGLAIFYVLWVSAKGGDSQQSGNRYTI